MQSDGCKFLSMRRLSSTSSENFTYGNEFDEDRLRDRTCSVIRRGSVESDSKTPHIQASVPENFCPSDVSAMIYNSTTSDKFSNINVQNIRRINNNESLWIDVIGVSESIICFFFVPAAI